MDAEISVGSLVRARGREWVVQPESSFEDSLLVLRPLGGAEDEITGISTELETVESASFPAPSADHLGNHRSGRLLRDAVQLGFRSGAGPFRSLAHISVDPRPYQLVPLLMALRQDPVRLLIADDVGVGKTVEALLIARELLDRGEIRRMVVMCPPHLAEQWQRAMKEQFQLDAVLVLASTARRLERELGLDETIFDRHPITVVSTDFIKSERRRDTFLNHCPELVIVDEAHTCADPGRARSSQQQRHRLLKGLVQSEDRHLMLVTATPYSGNDEAFRSLLALLNPVFSDLPLDLAGKANEAQRKELAKYLVLRRRADVERYLDAETPFPKRVEGEETYELHGAYRELFTEILKYARHRVQDDTIDKRHQRIRWWSVLALLRSLGSSPAAAEATLLNRAAPADASSIEEVDEIGRRTVLDLDDESNEGIDIVPGSDAADEGAEAEAERRRLRAFAKKAADLKGKKDLKLQRMTEIIEQLVDEGHSPILFCRFIPTVEYVVEHLAKKLGSAVTVIGVTGQDAAHVREQRVAELGSHPKRVLVCTDCLSEGINLQENFDAVVHYDLSWNPTRHEQREGRVDRYRQRRPVVKALTFYGKNNPVDGIVLDVLLRKHKSIRKALGISVPAPADTSTVMDAVLEGLILREETGDVVQLEFGWMPAKDPRRQALETEWSAAVERERVSRSRFAQHAIKPIEVKEELDEARRVLGDAKVAERFLRTALHDLGAVLRPVGASVQADLDQLPSDLQETLGAEALRYTFSEPAPASTTLLGRSHPLVTTVATHVMETALDDAHESVARRAAVVRTNAVDTRTTVLLARLRFHLHVTEDGHTRQLLAEDCALVAFTGTPEAPTFVDEDTARRLLDAEPDQNVPHEVARRLVAPLLSDVPRLAEHLAGIARERADRLEQAHTRVRKASRRRGVRTRVQPHLPVDVLGTYIYLPIVKL